MRIVYRCSKGHPARPRLLDPPKRHRDLFEAFVQQSSKQFEQMRKILPPTRRKKHRPTLKEVAWYFPKARGTKRQLIPAPGKYPCEICAIAAYNKPCPKQDCCMPFAYWATQRVRDLVDQLDQFKYPLVDIE